MVVKQEKGVSVQRQESWPELGEFCPRRQGAAVVQKEETEEERGLVRNVAGDSEM